VRGTEKGDGCAPHLRAHGFRWGRRSRPPAPGTSSGHGTCRPSSTPSTASPPRCVGLGSMSTSESPTPPPHPTKTTGPPTIHRGHPIRPRQAPTACPTTRTQTTWPPCQPADGLRPASLRPRCVTPPIRPRSPPTCCTTTPKPTPHHHAVARPSLITRRWVLPRLRDTVYPCVSECTLGSAGWLKRWSGSGAVTANGGHPGLAAADGCRVAHPGRRLPAQIQPMLAAAGSLPPPPGRDSDWAYEFKWDGSRRVRGFLWALWGGTCRWCGELA
jgi:hypothetical protein